MRTYFVGLLLELALDVEESGEVGGEEVDAAVVELRQLVAHLVVDALVDRLRLLQLLARLSTSQQKRHHKKNVTDSLMKKMQIAA